MCRDDPKMKKPEDLIFYSAVEERWNVLTHGLGFALGVVAFFLLLDRAGNYDSLKMTLGFGIFGLGLILLYAASTFYHSATNPRWRHKLNIFDHIAIFVLIAATYTPFCLVTLEGTTGWIILGVSWGIALVGTNLKIFFTGKYQILSTLMYVGMGWIIVFAIQPLMANLSEAGLWWLLAGGLSYTLGAVMYNLKKIRFNHTIFHLFVLGGSFCHFMSIYNHVHP